MKLTLIRHTKVDVKPGICYGQKDVELFSEYKKELEEIRLRIKDLEVDFVFSSPLNRCYTIARSLFSDKFITIEDCLAEMDFGRWEGLSWDEIFKTELGKAFFEDFVNTKAPDGESYSDLIERVTEFYEDTLPISEDKSILIVTHAGPIRVFLQIIEGISPEEAFERNINFGEVLIFDLGKSFQK